MASWMVHLRVADALLDKFDNLEETEFVVGNIAPDSGVPTPDWSAYVPDKDTSHFRMTDETGKREISPKYFAEMYFTEEQRAGYNRKQYSFYLGYYVHLLTDVLWKQEVWYPTVNTYRAAYDANPKEMIWKWKGDWYDLRKYITGFYREKRENLDREYPYLNEKQMDKFVEYAVEYIRKVVS